MTDYTIYCSSEQTRKAYAIGATIEKDCSTRLHDASRTTYMDGCSYCKYYCNPTAEQMIGWLEEQEPIKEIVIYRYERLARRYWCYDIFDEKGYCFSADEECFPNRREGFSSRKEATLAAIDAALEYLVDNDLLK